MRHGWFEPSIAHPCREPCSCKGFRLFCGLQRGFMHSICTRWSWPCLLPGGAVPFEDVRGDDALLEGEVADAGGHARLRSMMSIHRTSALR